MKVITIEDEIWLNEIAKIHEHLISENESNYQVTTTSISLRYEMLKARLKYSQDAIFVSEQNTNLEGFIWAHYEPQMSVVQIEVLYVKPEYRKQGIATHLKNTIEEWAISIGATVIESTVNIDNHSMIQLNNYLGYHTTHLKMTKNLKGKNE